MFSFQALTGERDVDNESDKPDALQEFFKSATHIESQAVGPKSLDVAATIAAAVNLPLNQPSPVPPVIRRVRQEPMDNGQGLFFEAPSLNCSLRLLAILVIEVSFFFRARVSWFYTKCGIDK